MKKIAALIPVLGLLAVACGSGNNESDQRVVRVRTQKIEPSSIASEVYSSARLEGEQEALLFASIPGTIEEVMVTEGDEVTVGQKLIRMSTDQQLSAGTAAAQAAVSAARANAENARANYERMQTLFDAGALSSQELDGMRVAMEAAEAQLRQAVAGYTQARSARDNAWITAPFSGKIGRVWAKEGNMTTQNPLLSVSGSNGLIAKVLLPESDIFNLHVGQPAYVTISALDNHSVPGIVTAVSPTVDPVSGQVSAEVHFDDPEHNLRPGLTGRVSIITNSISDAIVLPVSSLRRTKNGYQAAVVVDGRAELRDITTGITSDGNIQITSGIEAGDEVIVLGQNNVTQGGLVRVVNQ